MIDSVTYVKDIVDDTKNVQMILVEDGITRIVPMDTDNRHYQEIQEWVDAGNTISERW